ncbi:MAG: TPM domain-containing protein [Candidatus Ozemobacteraceae bacterium]
MNPRRIFPSDTCLALEEAIREAESRTSGEIRIHIERTCEDPVARGGEVFVDLAMHRTAERNGVLFYLAVDSGKFAIIADEGINTRVSQDFWDEIKTVISKEFSRNELLEGLCSGVRLTGDQLAAFFPRHADDVNELSNAISFGDA